ncbi:MAG TPA: hypothetical protein DDZ51_12540 [Planctomycetaceae bacterium]|nr:hypothetical protein [Planctomycetaceae bacterium]
MTGEPGVSKVRVNDADGVVPVLPDYGVFLRSPADGSDWIHPDDHEIVDGMVPSKRVFCRFLYDGVFYHFRYGEIVFRLRPCLWLPIRGEGIDIGDRVETTGVGLSQELFVSEVTGMLFDDSAGEIGYQLARTPISGKLYNAQHLRLLSDKTKLRPGDTLHPTPQWNKAFRDAYPSSEYLQPPTED